MKPDIEELRKKYIENPPEGMTSRDIRRMSEEELHFSGSYPKEERIAVRHLLKLRNT